MGQRHQIYVKLEGANFGNNNPNNRPPQVIGVHHQWLYGATAARQLLNLLKFHKNQQKYGPFTGKAAMSDPADALRSIYSVDIDDGYYHQVSSLGEDTCEDPRLADNNDGITVIDFSKKEAKYAFMSIHRLEGAAPSQEKNYGDFEPISAKEWIGLYYPDFEKPLFKGSPKKLRDALDITDEHSEQENFRAYMRTLADKLSEYKVLTQDELKDIFPKMFSNSK
jgi:hypothetical protein